MQASLPAPLTELDEELTATAAAVVALAASALSERRPAPSAIGAWRAAVTDGRRRAEGQVLTANLRHSGTLLGESRRYLDAAVVVAVALDRTAGLVAEAAHHRALAGPAPARAGRTAGGLEGASRDAVVALHAACAAFCGGDPDAAATAEGVAAAAAARARWSQSALTEALVPETCAWAARGLLAARCLERVCENARLISLRRLRVAGRRVGTGLPTG